jgi:selenide,water dikinase
MQGAYLWNWKDKIDRAWMAKYGENLPAMEEEEPLPDYEVSTGDAGHVATLAASRMRCGGCGSKVGNSGSTTALQYSRQSSNRTTSNRTSP